MKKKKNIYLTRIRTHPQRKTLKTKPSVYFGQYRILKNRSPPEIEAPPLEYIKKIIPQKTSTDPTTKTATADKKLPPTKNSCIKKHATHAGSHDNC